MRIDRKNRVKMLQNVGKYLIDYANDIVPEDFAKYPCRQTITVDFDVDISIPAVTVNTEYKATETLCGVNWSAT